MKKMILLYKQFYEMSEEIPDGTIISQLAVDLLLFFVLGFTMSQLIIFLVH